MEQPVVIRFRWTADELLRARGYHFRHICRPVFRFALHFVFALMILAGYGLIHSGSSVSTGTGLLVGGVYWFAFRRLEQRWIVDRQFGKRADRDVETEWQFAADNVRTRSSLGQSEINWQAFVKVVRTPHGIMLYVTDQIFHWLPRSSFVSDAEFERGIKLARSKIEKQYDVL